MYDECVWVKKGELYTTECKHTFGFVEGPPRQNGLIFCPYCGQVIYTVGEDDD